MTFNLFVCQIVFQLQYLSHYHHLSISYLFRQILRSSIIVEPNRNNKLHLPALKQKLIRLFLVPTHLSINCIVHLENSSSMYTIKLKLIRLNRNTQILELKLIRLFFSLGLRFAMFPASAAKKSISTCSTGSSLLREDGKGWVKPFSTI